MRERKGAVETTQECGAMRAGTGSKKPDLI